VAGVDAGVVKVMGEALGGNGGGAGDDDVPAGMVVSAAIPVSAVLFPVPACPSIITS
jgi:hypothetical protein